MAELNAKSAGRAVVLESAETGLGPSEFLVGDAHRTAHCLIGGWNQT